MKKNSKKNSKNEIKLSRKARAWLKLFNICNAPRPTKRNKLDK